MRNSLGDDPRKLPMKIFPAVHYSMGGIWVDYDQMTNIPGFFAAENVIIHSMVRTVLGQTRYYLPFMVGWLLDLMQFEYINGLREKL